MHRVGIDGRVLPLCLNFLEVFFAIVDFLLLPQVDWRQEVLNDVVLPVAYLSVSDSFLGVVIGVVDC